MKLFTREFVKKEAVESNPILLFLYVIATPLSKLFIKLNISPNSITWGSILTAILAFVSLIFDYGYIYFHVLWAISIHLDFCDGTVARMTGKTNKTSFRFDHMSDLFKISIIILGAGIRYNTITLWIISVTTVFLFLFANILNSSLDLHKYVKSVSTESLGLKKDRAKSKKKSLKDRAKNSPLIVNLVTIFAGINGHTLILFLIIPFGLVYTKILLIYFSVLTIISSIKLIKKLLKLPKIINPN